MTGLRFRRAVASSRWSESLDTWITGEPLVLALHAKNRNDCQPPLTEQEVEKIVKSASKWPEPPRWIQDPLRFIEDLGSTPGPVAASGPG